jgi:hypothetical protein
VHLVVDSGLVTFLGEWMVEWVGVDEDCAVRVVLGESEGTDASVTGYLFPALAQEGMTADFVVHRTWDWSGLLTWLLRRVETRLVGHGTWDV